MGQVESDDGSLGFRSEVLDTVLRWSTIGGALGLCVLLFAFRRGPEQLVEPDIGAVFAGYATVVVLHQAKALGYNTRAHLLLVLLIALLGALLVRFGPVPPMALCASFLAFAGYLFLGVHTLILTLVATCVELFAIGRLVHASDPAPLLATCLVLVVTALLSSGLVAWATGREQGLEQDAANTRARLREEEDKQLRTQATLADTEQALFRAQKLEAVGQLAAGVGHDFNNTLQVILSWTSLLAEEEQSPTIHEGLQAIHRAAAQGRELTHRLLTFGRRETASPVAVDPQKFVDELATSIRRLLPEDITLRLDLETTTTVKADPAQLDQVVLNLSLNARDAMPGGGTLTLGTRQLRPDHLPPEIPEAARESDWVDLWVRDNGVGMDSATLDHAFEPFFTTKGKEGTGLGLSTAYAIVRQNHGFITVESHPRKGTTFHVLLPAHAERGVSPPPISAHAGPGEGTVLLAEDEPLVRAGLAKALRKAGFTVLEAQDIPSSLGVVRDYDEAIDILCTDGLMPGGETRSLIQAFRERWPTGHILVCSGYVKEELLRRAIHAGELQFLSKPFAPQALVARLLALRGQASLPATERLSSAESRST